MTKYGFQTQVLPEVLRGPVSCGKTTALLARLREALEAGADPSDLLVLAPSATAAQALQARLEAGLGACAAGLAVQTPHQLALGLLDCEAAFAATGRRARVLNAMEEKFFHEDMLVLGKRNRRVREMLKFLERGWSELREEDDDWLLTLEEKQVNDHAKACLAAVEALHPCEVCSACVRWLAGDARALAGARVGAVFVDDARSMSRAAQVLAFMLASRQLVVCWDPNGALLGEDAYAYDKGLEEMLADNPQAQVSDLLVWQGGGRVLPVAQSILSQPFFGDATVAATRTTAMGEGSGSATMGGVEVAASGDEQVVFPQAKAPESDAAGKGGPDVLASRTLSDEMGAVAGWVARRIAAGTAPEEIFVATPTDAWTRRVARALGQAGIAATCVESRQAIGGDVRQQDARDARVFEALALAADPTSALAWRCWCGFGDYLTHSAVFARLRAQMAASGAGLADSLALLACADAADGAGEARTAPATDAETARVAGRYREGLAMVRGAQDLRGADLLAHLSRAATGLAEVPAGVSALLGRVGADETAGQLFARAEKANRAPVFAQTGVRVGSLESLGGQTSRDLLFAGMVNGLIPAHALFDLTQATIEEQSRLRARLVRRLYAAAGCARGSVTCSTFAHARLEEAEKLRLDYTRIRLVAGSRVVDLTPSVCVAYMGGPAAPRA